MEGARYNNQHDWRSSSRYLPDGFGTVPTLRGLPRFHRAVPSIALDENIQLDSIVARMIGRVKTAARPRNRVTMAINYDQWGQTMDEVELHRLLTELGSRYAIPRRKAIEALVTVGAPAVPGLITRLNDKNPEVQKAAAEALERIATPLAITAVSHWRDKVGDDASV